MAEIEEYEFTITENQSITKFTNGMYLLAYLFFATGFLTLARAFPDFPVWISVSGVVWLALGIIFYLPTDNFRNVVGQEGNDIRELMTGFYELKLGWNLVVILLLIQTFIGLLDLLNIL